MKEDAIIGFVVSIIAVCIATAIIVGILAGINATNKVNARLTKIGVACVTNQDKIWVHNNCVNSNSPVVTIK